METLPFGLVLCACDGDVGFDEVAAEAAAFLLLVVAAVIPVTSFDCCFFSTFMTVVVARAGVVLEMERGEVCELPFCCTAIWFVDSGATKCSATINAAEIPTDM